MKLNAGCGDNSHYADVNIDINPIDLKGIFTTRARVLDVKAIQNFVTADVQRLPFQAGVFEEVQAYHVLPHVKSPVQAVREMMRVLQPGGKLVMRVCWRDGSLFIFAKKNPNHTWSFTKGWFRQLARRLGVYSEIFYQDTFFIPIEVIATFYKGA